jgi:hypothetical protein
MIPMVICLGALFAMLLLAGCADGLAYGERTSISVASVRLNDDPAQPVAVKLGFDRDVVSVAPPIGGFVDEDGQRTASGEAVSQFSTFTVSTKAPFLPDGQTDQAAEQPDLLGVQSRFASGGAALEISDEPDVVAAVMGLGLRVPSEEEQVKQALAELDPDEQQRLCELADRDFGNLTDLEKEDAGELTGFLDLYDDRVHALVRSACQGLS